jgi:tRNA pseudouridine55 synthase
MYSAIKQNGKKLYDLAREGIVVEREARDITIHSLKLSPTDDERKFTLDVECSSGTYIRTLCADIGAALGTGGVMETLHRTRAGDFHISTAHTLEELTEMSEAERISLLLPTEKLFDSFPAVYLPAFYEKLCRNGCEIYEKKIRTNIPLGEKVRLYSESGGFFALGEVREYPDGNAIKAIKIFEL